MNIKSVLVQYSDADLNLFMNRSSHQKCSIKQRVLINLTKFTGKHLWQSLFYNKVAGLSLKFSRTPFHGATLDDYYFFMNDIYVFTCLLSRVDPPEMPCKKGVVKNFAIFAGVTCAIFFKTETPAQVLFCEFCKIIKNNFFSWTPQARIVF